MYVENSYQMLVLSISGTTERFIDGGGIRLMFMSNEAADCRLEVR